DDLPPFLRADEVDRPHGSAADAGAVARALGIDMFGPKTGRAMVAIAAIAERWNPRTASVTQESGVLIAPCQYPVSAPRRIEKAGVGFGCFLPSKGIPGLLCERPIHRAPLERAITFSSSFIEAFTSS